MSQLEEEHSPGQHYHLSYEEKKGSELEEKIEKKEGARTKTKEKAYSEKGRWNRLRGSQSPSARKQIAPEYNMKD